MKIKPKCQLCKRIYLGGRDSLCGPCLLDIAHKKKTKLLRCLCGKLAVVVILATVLTPEEEPFELEIPLCYKCCDLERTMEKESDLPEVTYHTNQVQIVVVKSLPRARQSLKGRIL
jgi:hypothetical protein